MCSTLHWCFHVDMTIAQVISLIPTSQTPVAVVMIYDYDEHYKEKSDVSLSRSC